MGDITQVARMLAERAQDVAEHLLPSGKREGSEWRAGSVAGEKGQSLGVHLTGQKAGVWSDFSTGDKGDLLDLWRAVRGLPLTAALDEARSWLGLARPELHRPVKRAFVRPPKPECRPPRERVRDYLTCDRNLSSEAIAAYKIGEAGNDIVFPFLLPDGTLALAKKRPAIDGGKPVPTARDCEHVLFGWQAVPENAREVVICEGEIDAASWWDYGFPAMSVPFGGGGGDKQRWIENEYDRLDRFERIYLALDMDAPGDEAAEVIAERLGRHRCYRVTMPRKDANECLVDGVSREDMARCIASAKGLDPEGLRKPSEYSDDVVALFWPKPGTHIGYTMPYGKLRDRLHFRPGEVTIWTGDSGAGKSQILSDCAVDWVKQGSRICLSSLEMKPAQTFKRMCKQMVGTDRPTEQAIRYALQWMEDGGLLAYDTVGKRRADALLGIFAYARARYGCDQFIIDSLMRLGIAGDDYNSQEQVIFQIVDWAIATNVHVHLVAHARKGERDRGAPETADIKGAMEIGANAFNIISVWRNRKLEEDMRAAKTPEEKAVIAEKPGVILNVAKQRNGDYEGKTGLWFDQTTYRYRAAEDQPAWKRDYMPADWRNAA